jgi:chromosome segregation ATPase
VAVTKRPGSGRDKRQDPDDAAAPPAANLRVDRVFAPPARSRPSETASQAAATAAPALPAANRTSPGNEAADPELSLRRQLSRLQRQLAEAQQELANRDDELASEVEKRTTISAASDALRDQHRVLQARVDELTAYQTRTAGVEARLLEIVTTAEGLSHERDREREQRVAAQTRVAELGAAIEQSQATAKQEREELQVAHAEDLERVETQKRLALDNAEEAITATAMRLREANEDTLAQLRAAHERTLAALRGELEPKALAARTLEEERERLINELSALQAEAARDATEREEVYKRELAQLEELSESERTAQTRLYHSELTRARAERDAQAKAFEQATQAAAQREQVWEQTVAGLRDAQKQLQIELAELAELHARLEADKASADERLASIAAQADLLIGERRSLRDQLEASESSARRNAFDRRRFVAYLEEGLALLGALPPTTADASPADPAPADPAPADPAPADVDGDTVSPFEHTVAGLTDI